MKNIINKIFLPTFLVLFLIPGISLASEIFFDSTKNVFSDGEEFLVKVFLNTEGELINAVEGKIILPENLLDLKEVLDGNSSINFWIEKPRIGTAGVVTFSGITAGGFSGSRKLLFSVVLRSKGSGSGVIDFSDLRILKNDGVGTEVIIKETKLPFSVSGDSSALNNKNVLSDDVDPPEDFKPIIGRDQSVLDDRYFVVFSTQDKGVGMDYYEVREGFWGEYFIAASPYPLKDQLLTRKIYVRAVDKNGNEKIVTIDPQNPIKWYQDYVILSIILVLVICLFFLKKLWQKFSR